MTDDPKTRKPGPPFLPPERRRRNKVMLALTDAELGALEAAAADAGQYVAEFARKRMLAAIKTGNFALDKRKAAS